MATTREREDFKDIMENVINSLKGRIELCRAEGQNIEYKGIWSIADYLARYYMANYYNTEEHEYFLYQKERALVLELAAYLARNWSKFAPEDTGSPLQRNAKSFDFRAVLNDWDISRYHNKQQLFWKWIAGGLDTEFRNYIASGTDLITEERKLRYLFVKEFRHFSANRIQEFKNAIGMRPEHRQEFSTDADTTDTEQE